MSGATLGVLPPLREDLGLHPGPRGRGGQPTWTIHDPVRNRYHRIGEAAFEILRRWHLRRPEAVIAAVARATGRAPAEADIAWLARFLRANMLVRGEGPEDVRRLRSIAAAGRTTWRRWLLHHYLFFRVPLVRPQRFLEATRGLADALASTPFLVLLGLMGLAGGYLVARQWEAFLGTFPHFFTLEGVLWYVLALFLAKLAHELGHAYTAARSGCRVPTMGVAFLVLWPVLYTDTSDAWRLVERRRRLAIGAAGMATELGLAVVATFLWSFLPDGPARSAAFLIATSTWVMTLAINLNPFMRFDGYYLLSDWLEVENLQDRSFARARWRLRELLFGLGLPPPEPFPGRLGGLLVAYALATWVYRLFLFLGIAVLVDSFFFKALGIFLFAVEIAWFILRPLWNEAVQWWNLRRALRLNANLLATLSALGGLAWLAASPWQSSIGLPAVLLAADRASLYPPAPARVEAIEAGRGESVAAGQVVFRLSSEDLDHAIAQAEREVELRRLLVRREAAGGAEARDIRVLKRGLAGEITRLEGLKRRRGLLDVRSPIAGRLADVEPNLHVGLWVDDSLPLALVVSPAGGARLTAFVEERDLDRVAPGASAVFYPDDPLGAELEARVISVASVNTRALDQPVLASIHGGPIAVESDANGLPIPIRGHYRVDLELRRDISAPTLLRRGVARVEGRSESPAARFVKTVAGILVRESGF